jgi:hypothetical protein
VNTETAIAEVERWAQCTLPAAYRELLPSFAETIVGEQVLLYPLDMVVERNETYQTKIYCPGHIAIGDDSGGRAAMISLTDPECRVSLVGHGSMDPDDFVPLSMTLRQWLDAECPVE